MHGFSDTVGLRLSTSDDGDAVVELEADDRHLNPHGTVHGGAIATLIDSAMGAAVASDGEAPVTIELKVTYLEPTPAGTVRARAKVRKRGKRITVVECEVTDHEGDVVALGLGTFTTISKE
jgi:uncharacterized protein (TIGR00369 family)